MPTQQEMQHELGELIFKLTPYKKMKLMDDWKEYIEWDDRPVLWNFREGSRRVNKAIRIPVSITHHNSGTGQDETYLDWLLIGYEGADGG